MDKTYIKIKDGWVYLYRAVDKYSDIIDFLLQEKGDEQDAKDFLKKAIRSNCHPIRINMNKRGTNKTALNSLNEPLPKKEKIETRQNK